VTEQPTPAGAGEDAVHTHGRGQFAIGEPITAAARRPGLEAVLFLADEPVDVALLAELIDATPQETEAELEALAAAYRDAGSGIEVRRAAGGWRLYTSPAGAAVARRFALLGRTGRLTQAALETLAVIAYKQPITRQAISDIRGVNADGAVRSLVARGFVAEIGRDPGPGQAVLYGTTTLLLERLGLDSLEELPPLTDHLPEAPAPDEPALDRLKEVRRRLAAGEDLPSLGGRTAAQTNTGRGVEEPDEDEDAMPPPATGRPPAAGEEMDELSTRLEAAARSAMGRLRAAVTAADHDDERGEDPDPGPDPDPDRHPERDHDHDEEPDRG
jgi:segregation and condensation protein B